MGSSAASILREGQTTTWVSLRPCQGNITRSDTLLVMGEELLATDFGSYQKLKWDWVTFIALWKMCVLSSDFYAPLMVAFRLLNLVYCLLWLIPSYVHNSSHTPPSGPFPASAALLNICWFSAPLFPPSQKDALFSLLFQSSDEHKLDLPHHLQTGLNCVVFNASKYAQIYHFFSHPLVM